MRERSTNLSFLQSERIIEVQDQQEMVGVLGRNDELLRVIKEHYERQCDRFQR